MVLFSDAPGWLRRVVGRMALLGAAYYLTSGKRARRGRRAQGGKAKKVPGSGTQWEERRVVVVV